MLRAMLELYKSLADALQICQSDELGYTVDM